MNAKGLPIFDPKAICLKCGSSEIATNWCDKEDHFDKPWITGDHMHRHCRMCGYEWLEAPLDVRKSGAPNPDLAIEEIQKG
jgi:hypothetical protein